MKRSYFAIELTPYINGGGYFEGKARFTLDNFEVPFNRVNVKIDTGCSVSTIPVKRLNIPSIICKRLKKKDIEDHKETMISYGVETGGTFHVEPVTKKQKLKCPAIKFKHEIVDFNINGVRIPANSIYLNYDRSGNVLIGMDILEKMISHIDVSKKTGTLLLLCAPRDSIDYDFVEAMKEHFDIDLNDLITSC